MCGALAGKLMQEMIECPSKKVPRKKQKKEQEGEIFLQPKEKHGSTYSEPQLHFRAQMIVAHDSIDNPPNVHDNWFCIKAV